MGALLKLEERLERLVGGTFARVFPAEIQPIEITAALRRECENSAEVRRADGVTVVPNAYRVALSPRDHDRLLPFGAELGRHLADALGAYIESQRYRLLGPLTVRLERVDDLKTGLLEVGSRIEVPAAAEPPAAGTDAEAEAGWWLETGGGRIPLTGREVVVGRSDEADLRLDDSGISRRHARITLDSPPVITDLGSTNGVIVDGAPTARAELRDGSRILLGTTDLVLRSGD